MLHYLTVHWKSETQFPQGNFRTFRWSSSYQQPNYLSYTFWELSTRQRWSKFILCKKMELFFGDLPLQEMQALIDAPGLFTDQVFLDLLQAKAELSSDQKRKSDQDSNLLLQKLQLVQVLRGETPWSQNLLYTYKGILDYQLQLVEVPIRKVNKFSGWVRNSSAVGSKRMSGGNLDFPEIQETKIDVKLNFLNYFMSPNFEFDDLGIPAGTLLYTLLMECFRKRKEVPEQIKYLLY